ncbi:MAG: ATP-binding protein [Oscillospiraceae bacterium]|nr:ATP-binding protein [Oscillospiraceae bacterium]
MSEKNLKQLLDTLAETAVYVIREDTHALLYFNRRVKEVSPNAALGVPCHEVWKNTCSDCPLLTIGDKPSNHTIHYNDPFGQVIDITADRILWDDHIPAFIITVSPHKMEYTEAQGMGKIGYLYSQSLITVFDEAVIVNLTEDYYVNCKGDNGCDGIPPRGRFEEENLVYSRSVIHPDDLTVFEEFFTRSALLKIFSQNKKQVLKRLRRLMKDGTYHMVEFSATRLENQETADIWCVMVFRDVQEEYLQECQRDMDMRQLIAASKSAYQILIAVNLTQNTYRMLEYGFFHLKNVPKTGVFDDLLDFSASTADPAYRAAFFEKFSRQSLLSAFERGVHEVSLELPQLAEDGEYHWNLSTVIWVSDPYSKDILEVTMIKNIDEEHRLKKEALEKERRAKLLLEDALQKAEAANMAKSQFLSRMSHDIRTPMNAILGLTALALMHPDEGEKLKEYLTGIQTSGMHLLGLINEVLDVSKIESGKMELFETEFDLAAVVADAASFVQASVDAKNQTLTISLPENFASYVAGDEQKLRQILLNILENASKYTPEKGHIRLQVTEEPAYSSCAGQYRFVITDDGIGMKPEFLSHIYEPFTRADEARVSKIPGTGLGMTIVYNLVSLMKGTITVDSSYRKGSSFTLLLPFIKKIAPDNAAPENTVPVDEDFRDLHVLLAEDNEINRQIAAEMLKELGTCVTAVENGLEAVETVRSHPAGYYHLVLMDIRMPVMDGYEATRQLRGPEGAQYPLPIFAMTADAFSEDVKKAHLAGMNGHLAKPISFKKLRQALLFCRAFLQTQDEAEPSFCDFSQM